MFESFGETALPELCWEGRESNTVVAVEESLREQHGGEGKIGILRLNLNR